MDTQDKKQAVASTAKGELIVSVPFTTYPKLKVRLYTETGEVPEYKTSGSSGCDLKTTIDFELQPMERKRIPTGIFIELPLGYEAQVRAKSGISLEDGLAMVNGVGTVDADYRGEVCVSVINLSDEVKSYYEGDRIAQLVIAPVTQAEWIPVDTLDELTTTERGAGGYGHTGRR